MRSDDWGCKIGSDIFDIATTAIVIIGKEKDFTPFHLDWTRAKNWAVKVSKVKYINHNESFSINALYFNCVCFSMELQLE